jgi:hypothetical protein
MFGATTSTPWLRAAMVGENTARAEVEEAYKLPAIPRSALPANAQKAFDELNEGWGPDFTPVTSKIAVDGQTAFLVQDFNDGGMSVDVFDAQGTRVAQGGAGEGEDLGWYDSP